MASGRVEVRRTDTDRATGTLEEASDRRTGRDSYGMNPEYDPPPVMSPRRTTRNSSQLEMHKKLSVMTAADPSLHASIAETLEKSVKFEGKAKRWQKATFGVAFFAVMMLCAMFSVGEIGPLPPTQLEFPALGRCKAPSLPFTRRALPALRRARDLTPPFRPGIWCPWQSSLATRFPRRSRRTAGTTTR
eukprot:5448246-Prymnesium_polylepis.1